MTFSVQLREIKSITPIPGADRIEVAQVEGFQCVVPKAVFTVGEKVVYIPEQAIVPHNILAELGLVGKLAGSNKNKVKAVKFKQTLSQGLVYKNPGLVGVPGSDLSELLGIVKWEPPVPTCLVGDVCNIGEKYTIKYNIENLKYFQDALIGEPVYITEKIHGTNMCIGYSTEKIHDEIFEDGRVYITSKGLGAKGLVFKNTVDNSYTRMFKTITSSSTWAPKVESWKNKYAIDPSLPVLVYGELYGQGIQDLSYGEVTHQFKVFDVYVGGRDTGKFLNYYDLKEFCEQMGLPMVTILHEGEKYYTGMADKFVGGDTLTYKGDKSPHMREGIVIKTMYETSGCPFGRGILKHINPDYLVRGGNTTEFE